MDEFLRPRGTTRIQRNWVTPHWSKQYQVQLYRLKVEGLQNTVLFDEPALRLLRENIDQMLGD